MRRLATVVAVVVLAAACTTRTPLAPDASGEEIYQAVCAACHGADLEGEIGPPLDAGSDAAPMSDEFYGVTITRGLGRMPSYGGTLTDEQVDRVIHYVRERQKEG